MRKPDEAEFGRLSIGKLRLSEGDTLVVAAEHPLTFGAHHRIREYFETVTPRGVSVMIVEGGLKLSVLEKAK